MTEYTKQHIMGAIDTVTVMREKFFGKSMTEYDALTIALAALEEKRQSLSPAPPTDSALEACEKIFTEAMRPLPVAPAAASRPARPDVVDTSVGRLARHGWIR